MTRLILFMLSLGLFALQATVSASASQTQGSQQAGKPMQASLSDLSWLAGHWEGVGIGGAAASEVYSAPAGNQMVGHFRQLRPNGEVLFYELITIVQAGDTLEYRIKHFNSDMTAWEEKNQMMTFRLASAGGNIWNFGGLTLTRVGADQMTIMVRIPDERGRPTELKFEFRRVNT